MKRKTVISAMCVGAVMTAAIIGAQKFSGSGGASVMAVEAQKEEQVLSIEGYLEGEHFEVYEPLGEMMEGLTVAFRYGCPYCQKLHPKLVEFEKQNPDIPVRKKHGPGAGEQAAGNAVFFYISQSMNNSEALHNDYFEAIENGASALDPETVNGIVAKNGGNPNEFWSKLNAEFLDGKLSSGSEVMQHYQALGVPTIIVNGKYRLKNEAFGGYDEFLAAAKALAENG